MTAEKRGPGRPKLADELKRLTLRLPAHLAGLVEEAAKREGVPSSEWLRRAALAYLNLHGR